MDDESLSAKLKTLASLIADLEKQLRDARTALRQAAVFANEKMPDNEIKDTLLAIMYTEE